VTALRIVGASIAQVDAAAKARGAARYVADVPWAGTLYGHVVRAQRAHALIVGIHSDAALKCPGVRGVVTAADLRGLFPYFGHYRADHPVLAQDKVRYWGEPVAVVVADSVPGARDASRLVDVDYRDLQAMTDLDSALATGAELVHPEYPDKPNAFGSFCERGAEGTNEAFSTAMDWGDVDDALARATHVESTRVRYPALYPYPMEPYGAQARFTGGVLEVQSNAQHPFQVQRDLARIFSLGLNRVRVTSMTIGGGYGAKSYTKIEPLASVCAWVLDATVRIVLNFEDSMYTSRADGAVVDVTTGFDASGLILARDIRIVLDTGAYVDNSVRVLRKAVECSFGPYRVPALRVRARAVYTNTTPASSYRGFGAFHTNPASESNLDIATEKLGIDPVEMRLRNFARPGECLVPGSRPVDADLSTDLCEVRDRLEIVSKPGKLQGIGFCCSLSPEGADPTSVAIVRLLADGTALLMIGSTEMGQGASTVLGQIVAEEIGLSMDQVTLAPTDTQLVPYQWTTGASRTTSVVGLSVQRACADVCRQLIDLAAALDGEDGGGWSWRDGCLVNESGTSCTPSEVVWAWFGGDRGEIVGTGRTQLRGDLDQWPALWEAGVAGVVVSVDTQTGQVEVDQLVTAADVGKAINPQSLKGQELGGATQALGGALLEEIIYDGMQIANANVIDYRVPRIRDLAERVETLLFERGDGPGPFGAKPVGEGAMTVVGGAILAAVARATGRWAGRLPLTPEYVWRLIHNSGERE
jgi:CO/xanthine dehydrogenase Mo-binding subunit